MDDVISRQAAIDAIEEMQMPIMRSEFTEEQFVFRGMSEALQAIKELPSAQADSKETSVTQKALDTISRQAVLDALTHEWDGMVTSVFDVVKALPSVQPETHEERTETHGVCLDAISRQAVIDAHYEYCNKHPDASFPVWSLKILKDLPSAQSERQKGEWIDYTEDGYVECPFCHSATNCDGNKDELHFCFSCGADMRGEQDE